MIKDHIELVQLLLDHDADTTVRDQWNRTALDYALGRGESDPIVQLLQMSCDPLQLDGQALDEFRQELCGVIQLEILVETGLLFIV